MKKVILMLAVMLTMLGCAAQVAPPQEMVLPNALVTQVTDDSASLNYAGRSFETDGTYVKGRKYYVVLLVADCDKCNIIKGVTKVQETSVQQAKDDIEKALKVLEESKKNYKKKD